MYFEPDKTSPNEWLKAPKSVFAGYWDEEEKTREVIDEEGWYATGDLGVLDEHGYLQVGSKLSMISHFLEGIPTEHT